MKIAVMGIGPVGQALAGKLAQLGHEVTVGTRDPEATLARTEPDYMGNPAFKAWQEAHPGVTRALPPNAAARAELIVNATSGVGSLAMLEAAGAENLAGKVLVDVANPLDFSQGIPPSLFVSNTDSLGEQIQRTFPDTKVVKALDTMNCEVMVDRQGPWRARRLPLRRGFRCQAASLRAARERRLARRARPRPRRDLVGSRHGDVRRLLAPPLGCARYWPLQHRGRAGAARLAVVIERTSVSGHRRPTDG
jgi:predicted dinucleotide-binding enzyme